MFKIVNNIKTHGFLLVAIAILGVIGLSSINSDTALAANTKNRMLGIATVCGNLKDNNEGTAHEFICKPIESKLKDNAGCDKVTYAITLNTDPTDESVTEKRWFIKPIAYKACYDKIETMLKRFEEGGNCVLGAKGSDKHNNCKDRDDDLSEILGCSNNLVYDSGDRFRAKPDAVSKCRDRLNAVGNLKLTIGSPDGTTKVSTVAVKDIGTDADTEGLGNNAASEDEEGSASVNCQGGPMGWLFCPMINYMTSTLQTLARLIDDLMQVKFLAQDGSAKSIESAWRAFLSIANIMLVIAFMVIVFSQSTGAGLNNYNIKRMLPRLVIAAVLMNISFYICALAIDVSNIVGASIMGLFIGGGSVGDAITNATGGPGGKGILGGALTGALLIGLLLFILTPVILSIIIVFVCLVARQLILICLILASPIAFVAWLLPNTEQYFKKWYSLFFQMLILYPAVMFIFGASLYFAKFLGAGGQGIEIGTAEDGSNLNEILTQIIQLIVLCIPLVALPLLIKGSSNIMGKIGGYANQAGLKGVGGAKGAGKVAGKGFKKVPGVRDGFEMMEQRKAVREQAWNRNKAKRGANRVGGAVTGRVISGVIPTETSRTAEGIMAGQAAGELVGLKKQEVENAKAAFQGQAGFMAGGETRDKFLQNNFTNAKTNEERAALADLAMQGGAPGRSMVKDFASQLDSGSEEAQALSAHLGKEHYPAIESGIPEITDFINSAGASKPGSAGKDAFKKVTAENIGKLDAETDPSKAPKSLNTALSTPGAISDATIQDALSERYRGTISEGSRGVLTAEAARRGISANSSTPPSSGGSQIRGGSGTGTGGGSVSWTPKK